MKSPGEHLNNVKVGSIITIDEVLVLNIIYQIIEVNAAGYTEINQQRWWHISAELITRFAPPDSRASIVPLVRWYLNELHEHGYVELKFIVSTYGSRLVVRVID